MASFLATQKQSEAQQHLRALADQAKSGCEQIPGSLQIKAVVTNWTKKYDSLERKPKGAVRDNAELRDRVSKGNPIRDHAEMGDHSGVRIGLCLPNDIDT